MSTLPSLTLVGTFQGADGVPLRGQVTFTPNAELTDTDGNVILPQVPIVVTVSNGSFSVNLLPCDAAGVSQVGWAYDVFESISYVGLTSRQSTRVTYTIQPTGTGTVNLATLAHYDPPPVIETYGSLVGNNTWTGTNAFQGEVTVPVPVNPTDAATKAYVDGTEQGGYLPLSGGTVTGDLTVNGNVNSTGTETLTGATNLTTVFQTKVAGDTQPRTRLNAGGGYSFGDGQSAPDTDLYRAGVNTLATDGALHVGGSVSQGGTALSDTYVQVAGDLGNTPAAPHVTATHLASPLPVNQGGTGSATQNFVDLSTSQNVGGTKTFTADTIVNGTLRLKPGGAMTFGTSDDTDLYRAAAGVLMTDGDFTAAGALTQRGVTQNTTQPGNGGFVAWPFDPAVSGAGGQSVVAGTVYLSAFWVNKAASITTLWTATANIQTVTSGQCFVGVYDSSGNLKCSADSSATVGGAGAHSYTVTSTSLTPGMYWFAQLLNFSGSAPQVIAGVTNASTRAIVNAGLSASQYRFCTNGTGQTSLPSTITPSSNSTSGLLVLWGAVS